MNATKKKVLEILLPAFRHNKSVVYIAGADDNRILALLSYCYDCCDEFGKIYLDEKAELRLYYYYHTKKAIV